MEVLQSTPPASTRIRASALWARFTAAERTAYDVAMQHNTVTVVAGVVQLETAANQNRASRLRQFKEDVNGDGYADLAAAKVQNKFNGLIVTELILTAPRATQILTDPITVDEAA